MSGWLVSEWKWLPCVILNSSIGSSFNWICGLQSSIKLQSQIKFGKKKINLFVVVVVFHPKLFENNRASTTIYNSHKQDDDEEEEEAGGGNKKKLAWNTFTHKISRLIWNWLGRVYFSRHDDQSRILCKMSCGIFRARTFFDLLCWHKCRQFSLHSCGSVTAHKNTTTTTTKSVCWSLSFIYHQLVCVWCMYLMLSLVPGNVTWKVCYYDVRLWSSRRIFFFFISNANPYPFLTHFYCVIELISRRCPLHFLVSACVADKTDLPVEKSVEHLMARLVSLVNRMSIFCFLLHLQKIVSIRCTLDDGSSPFSVLS